MIKQLRDYVLVMCLTVVVSFSVTGCGGSKDEGGQKAGDTSAKADYKATVTVGMITDLVSRVAGEKGNVVGLMKEGVDPHLYKATRNDVQHLMNADIIFYNGLRLEGKMQDALERVKKSGKPVYAVTRNIPESYLLAPEESAGHPDPHVWMDVAGWRKVLQFVTEALIEFDSENKAYYTENSKEMDAEMALLDEYVHEVIASIPEEQRIMLTAHDAFNYFGRAYDIDVRGIQGMSTESEAGIRDLNQLVELLVERDIGAVFVETSVADKNVKALIEGAKAKGHEVKIGGTLYSDAMGESGSYEGTYIGMIDHNATVISRALGGNAPEGGYKEWRKSKNND